MLSTLGRLGIAGCVALGAAGRAVAQTTEVVVPGANAAVEGPSSSTIPLAITGAGLGRYQQVYAGGEFPGGTNWITAVSFRANQNTALVGRTMTVSLSLSTTGMAPDGLSSTFADNVGPDATVVYSGTLTLPPVAGAPGPAPFGWTIPLQHAFLYGGGNLLLDLTITATTGGSGATLDAVNVAGDPVSRAYNSSDPTSATTSTAPSTLGLVTRFDLVPAASPLAASGGAVSAATGGSTGFYLQAGGANAGRSYLVVGGMSGSSPGTALPGGLTLPVNADWTTTLFLQAANTPSLPSFFGGLDGTGRAVAGPVVSGPLDPSAVGATFTFAFLLVGPFDFVSNPVGVSVAP
ncbi:MAG TPA: hypothetical protein VFI25_02235 [Planctomycetota bacterium]|nr:hypothetical protein [Planctomycetota bacterium]